MDVVIGHLRVRAETRSSGAQAPAMMTSSPSTDSGDHARHRDLSQWEQAALPEVTPDRRLCAPLSEGCFVEGDVHIRSFGVLMAWKGCPVLSGQCPVLPLMLVPAHGALLAGRASMVGMTTVRVNRLGRSGRAARPMGLILQDHA